MKPWRIWQAQIEWMINHKEMSKVKKINSIRTSILGTLLALSGCTSTVPTATQKTEAALGTDGETTSQSHRAAYYPSGVSLNFEGFIVGIDKSPAEKVSVKGDIHKHEIPGVGKGISRDIERIGGDRKLLYISQIYEYSGKPFGDGSCAHFSAYEANSDISFIEPCNTHHVGSPTEESYKGSWTAVDILKRQLKQKLENPGDYTHLVLVVMGWNTPQLESYRNFNSIMRNIRKASGDTGFKPLFVGVTWPSFWENAWFDPLWKGFSYRTKANDADELGLSWLGVVIRDVIGDLDTEDLTTIVVSHSFGARAASMAVCIGPAISRKPMSAEEHSFPSGIDAYIGLQPAFSINRFLEKEDGVFDEKINYPQGCKSVKKIGLTASANDQAVKVQFVASMVGDYENYKLHCLDNPNPMFHCAKATPEGGILKDDDGNGRLFYIDASELIRFNAPGTGGGSHSDIYRKETGQLIWEMIKG